jgi:hypothetical protein
MFQAIKSSVLQVMHKLFVQRDIFGLNADKIRSDLQCIGGKEETLYAFLTLALDGAE